jgi:DUF1707 SHOCT-like domain/Cell wall-active antibiotics response LiaF, C-terminal
VDESEVPRVRDEIRASDQDRDGAVALLSEHAAAGRLTLDELEERASVALAARTRGELEALTRDLPGKAGTDGRRKAVRWMVAVMGGSHRRGRYRLNRAVNVIAVMGGDDVDLRDAELDGSEVTLTVISIMGGASIYVPDTVEVEVSGFSLMGGDSEFGDPRPPRAGAPLVRVRSFNVMGGSTVYRLPRHARGLSLKQARRLAKTAGRLQLPAKD